jgi:hypothetical protein
MPNHACYLSAFKEVAVPIPVRPGSLSPARVIALLAACLTLVFGSEVCMADGPARVCRWFGGKKAALSLRFDDSHVTHADIAIPALDELGLVGTFLVVPGGKAYEQRRSVWESPAVAARHELADHTWLHHGARTDAEAEEQIGRPAEEIRRLQPQDSLVTFEPGGATIWMQRKLFASFDAKYHLYDVNDQAGRGRNVMSCSEVYSFFSVEAFRRKLEDVIAKGDWFQPHFHQIDETGHLRITPPVFRQVLEVAHEHAADLWQAGISAIHQYEEERDNAAVWVQADGDDALILDLTVATDPRLYTQPLTLEVDLPAGAAATVTDAAGKAVAARKDGSVLRFEVAPVDARYTIRASGLGAAAHLPEIKAPGPHPYVLLSAADIPALQARNSDPLAKRMWDGIIARADRLLSRDPATERRSDQPWSRMGQELSPIDALALAYALTGNADYAQAAAPRLAALAGEDWWHEANSEMLITSAATRTMGTAYDWLYSALTDDQHAEIRAAMVEWGLKPIAKAAADGAWWTAWYHCNWGSVIYGEAGVAALALLGDEPEAADWVRLSQRKIWHYMHSLEEDGSWGESATYAAFAWSNAISFADALRRVTGYDLFATPRLPKLPDWFLTMIDPSGESFVPFSNCWNGSTDSIAGLLFRLAAEYRNGQAQSVAKQIVGDRRGDSMSFLSYDPAVAEVPLTERPLDTRFDVDWAFLRSSWDDPRATLFGLKGGHKEWDHSHHDTNSFVLYALGRPLLVDLFYPHNIWGVKTEAHNTVMVDGREQAGRVNVAGGRDDPDHRGVIGGLIDTPWYARLVGDASMAYEPDNLTSFVREVMYLRHTGADTPPDYFVLFDDLVAPKPSRIDWMLHTYGAAQIGERGLTITQDEAAVDVTLVSPERFTSETKETVLRDIQTPQPFDGASTVKTIKLQPAEPESRTFFLSVLAPRLAEAPAPLTVTPVHEANTLGAGIVAGAIRDRVLFALDAPEMKATGVEAVGRSALVRQSGGRLAAAVLHSGQRLTADGTLLFETDSAGHAAITFGESGTEATLDLYNPTWFRLHSATRPAKVLVNGRERPFEYDEVAHTVTVKHTGPQRVQVQYE